MKLEAGVECGRDVEETEAGDLLVATGKFHFIVQRGRRVSVECYLMRSNCWWLRSELEGR